MDIESDIIGLLPRQTIKIRQIDGDLKQINISIPITIEDAFVIGLIPLRIMGIILSIILVMVRRIYP